MTDWRDVVDGKAQGCVVQGDCLDVLREMPDGCVDAVVTDPPFGIGFDYGGYDDNPAAYRAMMRLFVSEAQRLVGNGPIFVLANHAEL